jgi:hypothetical protein
LRKTSQKILEASKTKTLQLCLDSCAAFSRGLSSPLFQREAMPQTPRQQLAMLEKAKVELLDIQNTGTKELLPMVAGLKKMLGEGEGDYVDAEPIAAVLARIRAVDAAVPSGGAVADLSDEQVLAHAEACGWNWEGKEDEEDDELGSHLRQPEVEYDTRKREKLKAEWTAMSNALQKPDGSLAGGAAVAKVAREFLGLQRRMWCDLALRAFAIRQYLAIDQQLLKIITDEGVTPEGTTLESMAAKAGLLGEAAAKAAWDEVEEAKQATAAATLAREEAARQLGIDVKSSTAEEDDDDDDLHESQTTSELCEVIEATVEHTTVLVFAMLLTLRRFVGGPVQRVNRANTATMFGYFLRLAEGLGELQPMLARVASAPARLAELRRKMNALTGAALQAGHSEADLQITAGEAEEAYQHQREARVAEKAAMPRLTPLEQARKEQEALASWDNDDGGGGAGKGGKKGGKKGGGGGGKKKGKKGKKGGGKKKGGKKGGAGAAAGGGGSESDGAGDDGGGGGGAGAAAAGGAGGGAVESLLDMPTMLAPREAMRLSRRAARELVALLDAQGEIEGESVRRLWAGVREWGEPQVTEGATERLLDALGRQGWDEAAAVAMQALLDAVGAVVDGELGPGRAKHRATFRRLVSLHGPLAPCNTAGSTYVASSLIHACILHHMDPGPEGRPTKKVLGSATRVLEAYRDLVDAFAKEAEEEEEEEGGGAAGAAQLQLDAVAITAACTFERAMFAWAEVNARELSRSQAEMHASQAGLKKTLDDVQERLSLFSMLAEQGEGAGARAQARSLQGVSNSSSDLASQLEEIMVRDGPEDLGQFVSAALARGLRFGAFSREQLRERDPAALGVAMWRVMPLEAVCMSLESQAHMQEEEEEEEDEGGGGRGAGGLGVEGGDSDDEVMVPSVYASATLQALFPRERVQATILAVEEVSPSAKLSHLIAVLRAVARKLFRSMDADVAEQAALLSLAEGGGGEAALAKFDADVTGIAKGVVAWCTELERSPQRQRMVKAIKLAVESLDK